MPAVSAPATGAVLSRQDDIRAEPPRAGLHRWPDWALLAPPVITLGLMLWGVTAHPYWGDEADTVSAVSRSLPQLARMLGHIDAVHGLYYLLIWPVVQVAGPGEMATRLPSAITMAAAALGVTMIGRRLRSRRAGLYAGLVFALLPAVTVQAHTARPYAMVTAAAVLASLLLIRAAEDPRWGRLAAYGAAMALLGYLDLLALLLVPAHLITLFAWRRRRGRAGAAGAARGRPGTHWPGTHWPGTHRPGTHRPDTRWLVTRWLVTLTVVGVIMAPLVVFGWLQRAQIGWITRPTWDDVLYLIAWLTVGPVSAWAIAVLAALGGWRGDAPPFAGRPAARPRGALHRLAHRLALTPGAVLGARGGRGGPSPAALTLLTVPWLVLPPVTLLAASEIKPIYSFRYIIFCLPAVALLAGAGLAAVGWAVRAAALALLIALAVPLQLGARNQGTGMRAAAQLLARSARPGDAIIYPGRGIPPWYLAYPWAFHNVRDIGMAQSGPAAGRLYGRPVSPGVLKQRELGVRRIWVLETQLAWHNPAPGLAPGFRRVQLSQPGYGIWLGLYQRAPAAGG